MIRSIEHIPVIWDFNKTLFESQFFLKFQRIRENIKIDAFNLQSIFTVDINNHSTDLHFLSS